MGQKKEKKIQLDFDFNNDLEEIVAAQYELKNDKRQIRVRNKEEKYVRLG